MTTPALSIRDLAYTHRSGDERFDLAVPALDLAHGEQVLITGRSGSGKSTLLALIAGLLQAVRGGIRIHETDIQSLRGSARDEFRGRNVGMLFQTLNLIPTMSAAQNVQVALMFSALPSREHADRARQLLASLQVPYAHRPVELLSVGQQQRVAIARALATRPSIVLADEPTAALDPETGRLTLRLIQDACREAGSALLCVSHDPAAIPLFQKVVPMPVLVHTAQSATV